MGQIGKRVLFVLHDLIIEGNDDLRISANRLLRRDDLDDLSDIAVVYRVFAMPIFAVFIK